MTRRRSQLLHPARQIAGTTSGRRANLQASPTLASLVGNRAYSNALGTDTSAEDQPGRLGSGLPLPSGIQQEFEGLFGSSLEGIRIHTDSAAADLAASEQAAAFTIGRDIVFGEGRFAPGTQRGRTLLAHELAHTLQQRSRGPSSPASRAEGEARGAGSEVAQGRPGLVQSAVPVGIQKDDDDKKKPWSKKRAKASTAATASKREKIMGSMSPDQRRQVEILEQFGGELEQTRKDRKSHLKEEVKAKTRTAKSEKQRHVDPLKRVSGHHGFPQYLGGKFEQTLLDLGEDLHYLYHEELDKVLKVPRKLGSKYYKNLPPAERHEIFRRVLEHAQDFDKRYSKLYPDKRTRIAAALKRGIREAGFKVPSTGTKAKGSTTAKRDEGGIQKSASKKPGVGKTEAKAKAKKTKPANKTKASKPKTTAKPGLKPRTKPTPQTKPTKALRPKAAASPPRGVKPRGVGSRPTVSKPPKVQRMPKLPRLRGLKGVGIGPRMRMLGPAAAETLAALAVALLTAWLASKLDDTEERIQRDIEKLQPAIRSGIEEQAWIIERLVAENPWDPVYANISVGLRFRTVFTEQGSSERYLRPSGVSVTMSHKNVDKFEEGLPEYGMMERSRNDLLTFSVPVELEPEPAEDQDEMSLMEQLLADPNSEAEEELPPTGMRLQE